MLDVRLGPRILEDAVGRRVGLEDSAHRVMAHHPADDSVRGDDAVEDRDENDPAVDPPEDLADRHPAAMDRSKDLGIDQSRQDQNAARDERPDSGLVMPADDGPEPDQNEDTANEQPEGAKLARGYRRVHPRLLDQSRANSCFQ